MTEAANHIGAEAIEVTDVDSAAQALEARYDAEEVTEEAVEEITTDEVEEETEEAGEDNTDEAESEADDADDSDESDDSADEREAESGDADPQFHSVDELAEATGMKPEEFLENIKVKVKVNGEEKEVNLAEAVKGYQLESDYRQKTMTHADNVRAFEGEVKRAKDTLTSKLTEANNMIASLEESILGEYNNVDWQTLRSTDPGEYAALQNEYTNRYNALQQVKGKATEQSSHLKAEQESQQEAQRNEFLQKERDALKSAIPEWQDDSVGKAERAQLRDFLKSYNFKDDEIESLADHRMVLLLRDASKGKKAISKTNVALKKVSKAPRLQKPNAKTSKTTKQNRINADLQSKLRKNGGSVDDVAALLLARMG